MTLRFFPADETVPFLGLAIIRGTVEVAADGLTFTAPYTLEVIAPDGTKSEHYADQLQMYADFECKTENLYPQQLDANLESTTVLK